MLFMAASKAKNPAPALLCSLRNWIAESVKTFRLEPHIKAVLRDKRLDEATRPVQKRAPRKLTDKDGQPPR
jgi:hypothetical protein